MQLLEKGNRFTYILKNDLEDIFLYMMMDYTSGKREHTSLYMLCFYECTIRICVHTCQHSYMHIYIACLSIVYSERVHNKWINVSGYIWEWDLECWWAGVRRGIVLLQYSILHYLVLYYVFTILPWISLLFQWKKCK